ncbi:bactofilin family protein [Flavobacterium tibetense]|jgi:cytoskeletal protein CcmA (bactofilin family)|uniref:Polymer-forming cytoskeletal protein n=1 Tax=Flavobacterium tibetense TaxID=2233533 RepID=A0A365P5F8_9FLAO|nr:polymer-forming cytoskeletal protein [Flavobacterium tibetense]RBA29802.1 polymer-forming cytoskeletal protein [Flavobacterium tibetense]
MFDKAKPKEPQFGTTNRIVEGTIITGDINSKADFRLDGILVGNYTSSGKLVIGPSGEVQGDITCKNLDIEGKFTGKLQIAELLSVKSKAVIKGEVQTNKLAIEPGAVFEATCAMKSQLIPLTNDKSEKTA